MSSSVTFVISAVVVARPSQERKREREKERERERGVSGGMVVKLYM